MDQAREMLKVTFGHDGFRGEQERVRTTFFRSARDHLVD